MDDMNKYYEILGLEPGASPEEVKQAYRDMVKVWHPDRFPHDPRLQQKAEEKLKEINYAYEKLQSYQTIGSRSGSPPRQPQAGSESGDIQSTKSQDLKEASPVPFGYRLFQLFFVLIGFAIFLMVLKEPALFGLLVIIGVFLLSLLMLLMK